MVLTLLFRDGLESLRRTGSFSRSKKSRHLNSNQWNKKWFGIDVQNVNSRGDLMLYAGHQSINMTREISLSDRDCKNGLRIITQVCNLRSN